MFIGSTSRYNKVVPICTVEADGLNGIISPLILELVSRQVWVVRLSAQATLQPQKKLWFSWVEAGWALVLAWMFWRKVSSLARSKI